ncbi:Uncharacterised protein [Bordetella pertussis]|nr:Uncharacterised protein [Bordetella pertussis]CFO93495.1 Uncharacterised protein [Bordetella pertussis]CFT86794.1 Uncharacterised protein [Bordetella pertussis]CFW54120.1 Uncharacterised protein [Bordetella pertussis]CPO47879.1 Uncharacterised protein [Bordetella pertussis]
MVVQRRALSQLSQRWAGPSLGDPADGPPWRGRRRQPVRRPADRPGVPGRPGRPELEHALGGNGGGRHAVAQPAVHHRQCQRVEPAVLLQQDLVRHQHGDPAGYAALLVERVLEFRRCGQCRPGRDERAQRAVRTLFAAGPRAAARRFQRHAEPTAGWIRQPVRVGAAADLLGFVAGRPADPAGLFDPGRPRRREPGCLAYGESSQHRASGHAESVHSALWRDLQRRGDGIAGAYRLGARTAKRQLQRHVGRARSVHLWPGRAARRHERAVRVERLLVRHVRGGKRTAHPWAQLQPVPDQRQRRLGGARGRRDLRPVPGGHHRPDPGRGGGRRKGRQYAQRRRGPQRLWAGVADAVFPQRGRTVSAGPAPGRSAGVHGGASHPAGGRRRGAALSDAP